MALTPPPATPVPAAPTAPGDAPSRANPTTFRALADAFVVWLVGFRTSIAGLRTWLADYMPWAATHIEELNALQLDVTSKQSSAGTAASTATTKAGEASASAANAASSRSAIDNRIYPGTYSSDPTTRPDGTAIQNGDIYISSTAGAPKQFLSGVWSLMTAASSADLANATDPAKGASLVGWDSTSVAKMIGQLDVLNRHALLAAHEGFRKLERTDSSGPFYVGITGYGDSMASDAYTMGVLARALQMRYGLGGLFTPGLGQSWLGATWTFGGGATQARTDYTWFPGANQINMPAASTAQITTGGLIIGTTTRNNGAFPQEYDQKDLSLTESGYFKKVRCFYLTRPGDGSLTFTVSQTGVTGYTPQVVSCNAALGLSFVDITVIDPGKPVTLQVSAATATCQFVGAVFLRSSGVLFWLSQVGGSTMVEQNAYITNGNVAGVYAALCSALSTALVIHCQRATPDAAYQANYTTVFNALDAIPGLNQLVLGEPPTTSEGTPTVAVVNAYLRNVCLTRGYAFIDLNKMLGSSASLLTALGWNDGDGVHMDEPAHRYLAGKILAAVDWFRVGANKLDADPLTMGQLLKRRMKWLALQGITSYTISGRAGVTVDGAAVAGGFTNTATNQKGFEMTGAAALGSAASRPGVVPMSVTVKTDRVDFCVAFTGYRNLNLTSGNRGFALVGVNATFSTLTGLNQRCFGFEVALGSDVGSPGGVATEVIRLLHCDGVTVTSGGWVDTKAVGELAPVQGGLNVAVVWNKTAARLELYRASAGGFAFASALDAAHLASNSCTGQYVNVCLVAENGANVPASAASMSFLEIKSFWGAAATVFGLARNDLIDA